ncbi:MAG: ACT domain-containing protein [Candidatus Gracilibacteria bacterium]
MERSVTVNKIGGANMSKLDQVLNLVRSLREEGETPILVVSAFKGVTNKLYDMLDQLHDTDYEEADIDRAFQPALDIIKGKIDEFFKTEEHKKMAYSHVLREIQIVKNVLRMHKRVSNVLAPQAATYEARDKVIAFGERSVIGVLEAFLQENRVMAEAVNDVEFHANGGSRTSKEDLHEGIQEGIATKLKEVMHGWDEEVLILGGHIKGTPRGMTVDIGRSYSDTTAVDVTAALSHHMGFYVDKTVMWKEVDGVMSADPRQLDLTINTPIVHEDVSYDEAFEMAGSGSQLMQIDALRLGWEMGIPLVLKNIDRPKGVGTTFGRSWPQTAAPFKVVMANRNVDAVSYKIPQMANQPGFLHAMTGLFDQEDVSVTDIFSSGIVVGFSVNLPSDEADQKVLRAKIRRINRAMENLVVHGKGYACTIEWHKGDANLVLVGDELKQNRGVFSRITSVLAEEGINIRATTQTHAERRISFMIPKGFAEKAVQALHREFLDQKKGA